ncbi:MAG: hypothetical protein IJI11_05460 [Mogibacterium sp.]|nr:hypothetical protein [Mogibacterium sp.]
MRTYSEEHEESSDSYTRALELASRVIGLSRDSLFVKLHYMQRAISNIEIRPYTGMENILFACDGRILYYDPLYVLARYKDNINNITHALLHSVLHFVFHHGFTAGDMDTDLWDLSCDIAAENIIRELGCSSADIPEQTLQNPVIADLSEKLPLLNAENIYRHLNNAVTQGEDREGILRLRNLFRMDQHSLWPDRAEKGLYDDSVEMMRIWQDTSRRMQTELETTGEKGVLSASLGRINRSRQSYAAFLRRFGNHGEIMRLSEDEFDNNYYSYGLELYGNIPLIENLEYREDKHIREFAVAIDTSGSVQGETVRKFVQRTYDLIKSQETFDTRMKLHIIQCDDRIREDVLIGSDEEFERYIQNMKILGLGETDFRPVFAHIDRMLEEHRLTNLAGLLYFTDGKGIFPARKPTYDTAFIIHSDEVYPPEVPPWAMRVMLEEDMQ